MASSWINWGFSLIFSAVLARAIARRFAAAGRRVDCRALGAASLVGLGSVWAQGLSGSAAIWCSRSGCCRCWRSSACARDVMGYTFLVFLVLVPLVLVMTTLLGTTLPYPL